MDGIDCKIVRDEVENVITGLGFELVDVKVGRTTNLDDVTLIIYKDSGVNLQDCTDVSRAVGPYLEKLEEFEHLALKVSSPGIDRVIRNIDEYRIFRGKGVKVLLMDKKHWTGGIIAGISGNELKLQQAGQLIDIDITNIKKAKLDFTQEVNNI